MSADALKQNPSNRCEVYEYRNSHTVANRRGTCRVQEGSRNPGDRYRPGKSDTPQFFGRLFRVQGNAQPDSGETFMGRF